MICGNLFFPPKGEAKDALADLVAGCINASVSAQVNCGACS